ncbi:DUF2589 domain-containing protein [Francisella sp. SYW-2]|uniref:DUF2589 domain-containing protein n=1 Tax=Francisella sp. SYW-2 TaxID=2610886 RepID=UPI001CD1931B|nr:DUF2589 domain-containing protein [Francisella sp. SYW-2]
MANDIDKSLIGDVLNALPMDQMIAGPLNAMVSAQINASKSYVDFLTSVCIKDGKAEAVEFSYEETLVDESGSPVLNDKNEPQVLTKHIKVPLLAIVSHPNITIEEGTIDFEMEVSQSASQSSSTEAEASLEGGINWGVFSVSVKGRVSHKSEQTRSTDTRAKYSIHTKFARQGPPEAMMRVIDYITNANSKPINNIGNSNND